MELKVSVCIFVYNLERFIAKAIESVLMQRTDFDFEIIIGEDKSTDRTRDICIDYQKKYPDKIKLLLREENLGMKKNVFDTLKEARGKYVAILDGDDFWIDPLKLQRQADFLDSNPKFSLCCHNSLIIYEDHDFPPALFNSKNQKDLITINDIILNWSMATASMFYRNSMMTFPEWIYKAHNFDVAIQVLLADKGSVKYLNELMSVYRKSKDSNSFNPNYPPEFVIERQLELFKLIDAYFNKKYCSVISLKCSQLKKALKETRRYRKMPYLKYLNPLKYFIRFKRIFHIN